MVVVPIWSKTRRSILQNQRNNANKIQCEYTPQGCTSQWNNSMTMKIDTKRGTSDISRDVVPSNMPIRS